MFEEYTGPAAIFEYDDTNDSLVLIRANYKYLKLFEIDELTFSEARKKLRSLAGKEATQLLIKTVKESIKENKELTCNAELRTYIKQNPVWIKNHIWEISRNGQKHSFYLLAEDITSEKMNECTLDLSNNHLGMMMDN
jgi:hypothetical protein